MSSIIREGLYTTQGLAGLFPDELVDSPGDWLILQRLVLIFSKDKKIISETLVNSKGTRHQ
jgi:hypothetical protein